MYRRYHNGTLNGTSFGYDWSGGLCGIPNTTGIHVYTTMLILLAIVSTVENLVVIIIICKNKVLRTPSLLLLGILAGIDFLTGCVVTPIKASITQFSDLSDNWETVWAFGVLFMAVVILSMSTVMLISFDRFCHVYFLDNYNPTKKKMCIALFSCWTAPIVFIILLLAGVRIGYAGAVFALVYFFLCIFAMIIAYVATVIALKKHASNSYYATRQDMLNTQRKAVKTVMIIVTTFIVMNIPPILSVALLFMGISSGELCAITFFVMLTNSAVNPLIYCLRIPIMKEKVLTLLMMRNESADTGGEFRDISITEPNVVEFQITPDENQRSPVTEVEASNEKDAEDSQDVANRKYVNFQ